MFCVDYRKVNNITRKDAPGLMTQLIPWLDHNGLMTNQLVNMHEVLVLRSNDLYSCGFDLLLTMGSSRKSLMMLREVLHGHSWYSLEAYGKRLCKRCIQE